MTSPASRLQQLITAPEVLLLPGAFDGVSAALIDRAGFDALSISGNAVSASRLGLPDLGLLELDTLRSVAVAVRRVTARPVLCDAEAGFGGSANVTLTVRTMIEAGVAGIHIEDQVMPKRCGALLGREVVPVEEMLRKLAAAQRARGDHELVIVARTDAKLAEGVPACIERMQRYLDAGADAVLAGEAYRREELAVVAGEVTGPLLVVGGVNGIDDQFLTPDQYQQLGIAGVLLPFAALFPAQRAMAAALGTILETGVTPELAGGDAWRFDEHNELLDLAGWIDEGGPSAGGAAGSG